MDTSTLISGNAYRCKWTLPLLSVENTTGVNGLVHLYHRKILPVQMDNPLLIVENPTTHKR